MQSALGEVRMAMLSDRGSTPLISTSLEHMFVWRHGESPQLYWESSTLRAFYDQPSDQLNSFREKASLHQGGCFSFCVVFFQAFPSIFIKAAAQGTAGLRNIMMGIDKGQVHI